MAKTIYTILRSGIEPNTVIFLKPSMAEVTEIGGVIIPSANKAAPTIMEGKTNHFFLLLTSANNENIPPSPLLSALNVRTTYFNVVCRVRVQIIHDKLPKISD